MHTEPFLNFRTSFITYSSCESYLPLVISFVTFLLVVNLYNNLMWIRFLLKQTLPETHKRSCSKLSLKDKIFVISKNKSVIFAI